MTDAPASDFCPYVGLQPFTADDRRYFFGREREQRVISANLFAAPLTILYGPSAVGKSSVLQAGVVPRLAATSHTAIVYFASWQGDGYLGTLKNECREAIEAAHGQPIQVDDSLPLDEWILTARQAFRGTLFLIFDQFEEYLLYHREEDDSAFDADLARIVNRPEIRCNLLIGLRDDSLSKLNRFSKRIPNLMGNTLQLKRLVPEAARQAIVGPIDEFNQQFPNERRARIEESLVTRVLEEVRTEKVAPSLSGGLAGVHAMEEHGLIETAFLQLVLTELWRSAGVRDGERVLSSSTLDALGGAKAIVRRHVDRELGKLSREGQEIAARLFQHLVTPTGAKYALRTEDLVELAKAPADRVAPVLSALTAARLLRRIDPPERYEIFHDAFAVAMLDWRKEHAQRGRLKTLALAGVAASLLIAAIVGVAVYLVNEQRDKADLQRQLDLAIGTAQSAAEAATKATASAEQSTTASQLQLEGERAQFQLRLEAELARVQTQTQAQAQAQRTRAVDLQQQANVALTKAAEARAQSQKLDTESKAAAQATQKGVADLTDMAKEKGVSYTVPPPVQNAVPMTPPPATRVEPLVNEAPNVRPDAGPIVKPADVRPSGNYRETYRKAVEAKNQRRWKEAASLFETALQQNATESTERINISGFGNVEPYVPHFYLGVSLMNLKNCADALSHWDASERAGAIQQTTLFKSLQQNRDACVKNQ